MITAFYTYEWRKKYYTPTDYKIIKIEKKNQSNASRDLIVKSLTREHVLFYFIIFRKIKTRLL